MDKEQFLNHLRELVGDGNIGEALDWLNKHITRYTDSFSNDILMLKSRFSLAKNQFTVSSTIEFKEYGHILACVGSAILDLSDKIEKRGDNPNFRHKGQILHKIPSKMTTQVETKCVIRIAYNTKNLLKDIEVDSETEVRDIQITEIMSVELLDNNKSEIFKIRTCTEEEQFLIHDDFTQWIFFVQALAPGCHSLLLKIAVVEQINGKDRKRNIVFEKEITIESKEMKQEETIFTSTKIKFINAKNKQARQEDILNTIAQSNTSENLLEFDPATGEIRMINIRESISDDPDRIIINSIPDNAWACFLEGTKIMLIDRTEKNIEDLKPGEEVLTKDRLTGKLNIKSIKDVIVSRDIEYLTINNSLKVTPKELIVTKRGSIAVCDLKMSDHLEFFETHFIQIFSIKWIKENVRVFNLKFEEPSLFFANKFLVGDLISKKTKY